MVKLFLAPRFNNESSLRLLGYDFIQQVKRVEDADFVVVPTFVRGLSSAVIAYLDSVRALCKSSGKPGIVCKGGDIAYRFSVPGFIVFSSSLYGSLNKGEYAVPAPVENIDETIPFSARHKRVKPKVSFCGYAGFSSLLSRLKYWVDSFWLSRVYRRGIYFRRTAMQMLENDSRLDTSFIVRNTFSGKSGRGIGHEGREEYLNNIIESDFVLCPKGDGNYSARFYETLALGRIPILIDTDMVLPLEKEGIVDYSSFIVRVPYTELEKVGDYIMEFWEKHDDSSFVAVQEKARETFKKYLRHDAYYRALLPFLKKQEE